MLEAYKKPALTFNQQLEQLCNYGLIVTDKAYAISQLSTVSYYRLSAYWYPFRIRDSQNNVTSHFISGTKFEECVKLYEFDRQLRLLVIDAIERIEVHIRTLITYHLGHTYGAFGHTNPNNFHPEFDHKKWLSQLEEETGRSSNAFIMHYKNRYEGFPRLPIWMLTEVMSFGALSFCYTGLHNDDKRVVASKFDIHHKRLADWLHKLAYIRNVCAHHSRLWNRELSIRPENVRDPFWNPPVTPRKDRIFYILLMLRFLLKTTNNGDNWSKKCTALIEPLSEEEKYLRAMGMPENWKEHPLWK